MKRVSKLVLMLLFVFMLFPKIASAAGIPINIDGYYDDWIDKPSADIHYSSDSRLTNKVSLIRDEKYIYLHVKMADDLYKKFNGNNYNFKYDEKLVSFVIEGGDNNGMGNHQLRVRYQNGWTIVNDSKAYLTRYNNGGKQKFKSDEAEIMIPIAGFENGIKPADIKTISFNSPNLGPQWVTCTGTDTNPYLGIGISIALSGVGYLFYKKKRKRIKL